MFVITDSILIFSLKLTMLQVFQSYDMAFSPLSLQPLTKHHQQQLVELTNK